MDYDKYKHHRRSSRLRGYDYSQAGAYFVTICAQDRECLFGDVVYGEMRLNDAGIMVRDVWLKIPGHFSYADIDEFVVMPNHFHGIVVICNDNCRGEVSSPIPFVSSISKINQGRGIPEGGETPPLQRRTLGQIVAYLKYQSTKQINEIRNTPGFPLWQRNYYEHIIRSEEEMKRTREYIINNPLKWSEDEDNAVNFTSGGLINQTLTNIFLQ
jgi:REP element-mobilizing transposase RayT